MKNQNQGAQNSIHQHDKGLEMMHGNENHGSSMVWTAKYTLSIATL